ncbi:unnamed protein product [Prorocentrum cordatum]|uniref:EF-hand domain-containing protein n=1 Tax=Prorocentrum cordatum TaxID=2364126 RepID=A0ABN9UBA2_9DINO|nr:unnamed protein product [Polarella glacialis]
MLPMLPFHRAEASGGAAASYRGLCRAVEDSWSACVRFPGAKIGAACGHCRVGHALGLVRARAGTCDGCLRSVEEGEWVSECAPCAWYLCHRCQLQQCSQYSESETLEEMLQELFRLHDLNGNGALEEEELVQLNSKVAMLHHGRDSDLEAVKAKYRALFREKLDPLGRPVGYATFRGYVQQVLQGLDRNLTAQEMIVEQFVAEAGSARAAFRVPSFAESADGAFLSKLSLHSSLLIPSASEAAGIRGPLIVSEPSSTPHQNRLEKARTQLPSMELLRSDLVGGRCLAGSLEGVTDDEVEASGVLDDLMEAWCSQNWCTDRHHECADDPFCRGDLRGDIDEAG